MAIAGVPCPLVRANGSATANDTAVCCVTPAFAAGANPAALNLSLSVPEVGDALLTLALALALALTLPPTLPLALALALSRVRRCSRVAY